MYINDGHCYPFTFSMLPYEIKCQVKSQKQSRSKLRSTGAGKTAKVVHSTVETSNETAMVLHSAVDMNKSPFIHGKCIFCLAAPAETVFVHGESGHRCYCSACTKIWKDERHRECPVCRERVDRTIRLFDAADYDD